MCLYSLTLQVLLMSRPLTCQAVPQSTRTYQRCHRAHLNIRPYCKGSNTTEYALAYINGLHQATYIHLHISISILRILSSLFGGLQQIRPSAVQSQLATFPPRSYQAQYSSNAGVGATEYFENGYQHILDRGKFTSPCTIQPYTQLWRLAEHTS